MISSQAPNRRRFNDYPNMGVGMLVVKAFRSGGHPEEG